MLVERAVRLAKEAGLSPVIAVVLDAALIEPLQQQGAVVLLNRRSFEGIASSIHTGISWAKGVAASGAVIMTCDQIAVTAEHLRTLCETPESAAGSGYSGKIGVPAYFPASFFDDLLQLEGDAGAAKLLRAARSVPTESLAFDVDTEEDLARARATLGE
jgi:CTP:molybdopterin cytidylyltransferase MocA